MFLGVFLVAVDEGRGERGRGRGRTLQALFSSQIHDSHEWVGLSEWRSCDVGRWHVVACESPTVRVHGLQLPECLLLCTQIFRVMINCWVFLGIFRKKSDVTLTHLRHDRFSFSSDILIQSCPHNPRSLLDWKSCGVKTYTTPPFSSPFILVVNNSHSSRTIIDKQKERDRN